MDESMCDCEQTVLGEAWVSLNPLAGRRTRAHARKTLFTSRKALRLEHSSAKARKHRVTQSFSIVKIFLFQRIVSQLPIEVLLSTD
jgi:hypothetical protein